MHHFNKNIQHVVVIGIQLVASDFLHAHQCHHHYTSITHLISMKKKHTKATKGGAGSVLDH